MRACSITFQHIYGLGTRQYSVFVDNTEITDLVFAVNFAESLEVLVMTLEALHEEAKPLCFLCEDQSSDV